MDRIPTWDLPINRRVRERNEQAAQAAERMQRAADVFRTAACDFRTKIIRKSDVIASVGAGTVSDGVMTLPSHDDPVQYRLASIILPSRHYRNPESREVVPRAVAATFGIFFDTPRARGLINDLPFNFPAPDRTEISCRPIVLGNLRFDDSYKSSEVRTISDDHVRVYDQPWEQVSPEPVGVRYPFRSYGNEQYDWEALMAYQPEAITQDILNRHADNGRCFDMLLTAVNRALQNHDPEANPLPKDTAVQEALPLSYEVPC